LRVWRRVCRANRLLAGPGQAGGGQTLAGNVGEDRPGQPGAPFVPQPGTGGRRVRGGRLARIGQERKPIGIGAVQSSIDESASGCFIEKGAWSVVQERHPSNNPSSRSACRTATRSGSFMAST